MLPELKGKSYFEFHNALMPTKVAGNEMTEHPDMVSALLSHHSAKSKKLQLREMYAEAGEERGEISAKAQHVLVQLQK